MITFEQSKKAKSRSLETDWFILEIRHLQCLEKESELRYLMQLQELMLIVLGQLYFADLLICKCALAKQAHPCEYPEMRDEP